MLKKLFITLISFIMMIGLFIGCKGTKNSKSVELAYVEWSSEVASTNVVKAVLQERMGYDVKISSVAASAMWQAVASGDVDAMVSGWLPTTQKQYLEKSKDKVDYVRNNLVGTKIGLVVPKYVTINSISELNSKADKFDGKIIGIDEGAGITTRTEDAIKEYGLGKKFKLVTGSGATMTAALQDAIKNKKWIVVTGWTPHWKFARFELKYLQDPKKTYGDAEYIATIVRKGLEKDKPEVYKFLKKFNWTPAQMQEVMVMNREKGADPYETAKKWIEKNKDTVDKWLE